MSRFNKEFGVRPPMRDRIKSAGVSQGEELPSYRYYGVRRRARPWLDRLILAVWYAFFGLLFILIGAVMCLVAYGFLFYYPELWIKVIAIAGLIIILGLSITKPIRHRIKFFRRLKKLCRKTGASCIFRPNFILSREWLKGEADFCIETDSYIFFSHFLMPNKYRSTVYIKQSKEITIITAPPNNKFSVIFGRKAKAKKYSIQVELPLEYHKEVIHALVINPDCQKFLAEKQDGGFEATGNGGIINDLTVYTADGFFEILESQKK